MNKRLRVFFLLSCFITLVCRCNPDLASKTISLTYTDGTTTSCYSYIESDLSKPSQPGVAMVSCKFSCPNDSSVTEALFLDDEFVNFMKKPDHQALEDKVCKGASGAPAPANAQSNPVATATPTETPTLAPTASPVPVVPLNAYLTGAFTTCDSTTRYVNFLIAKDAPAYDPATFKLLFNGQPAQCTPVDNSDPKVLSCTYPPAPNNPPASIQVFIGSDQVNDFKFEGGMICDPVHHNNNQPSVSPTPTP